MQRSVSHYLFVVLTLIFLGLLIFSDMPFPIVIGLYLMSWCGLALLVMVWQRISRARKL